MIDYVDYVSSGEAFLKHINDLCLTEYVYINFRTGKLMVSKVAWLAECSNKYELLGEL